MKHLEFLLGRNCSLSSDDEGELPTNVNEEFRPFMRRLSEFKFWYFKTTLFKLLKFACLKCF